MSFLIQIALALGFQMGYNLFMVPYRICTRIARTKTYAQHCIWSNVVFFIENYFQKDFLENTIEHEIWISNFKLTILSRLLALSSPENNIWFITLFLASTQAQSDCACGVSYMSIKFKKGCYSYIGHPKLVNILCHEILTWFVLILNKMKLHTLANLLWSL